MFFLRHLPKRGQNPTGHNKMIVFVFALYLPQTDAHFILLRFEHLEDAFSIAGLGGATFLKTYRRMLEIRYRVTHGNLIGFCPRARGGFAISYTPFI